MKNIVLSAPCMIYILLFSHNLFIMLFVFHHCRDEQERQPLSSNNGVKKHSIVESDGKVTLGEIIGKNSAV